MREEGRIGPGRYLLFWSIAIGGTLFDLVTKSIVFAKVGAPPARQIAIVPNILELHTSENTGALWGFGAGIPGSSLIFAGLSVVAAAVILYYLFVLGAASSRVLTVALGLIMAGAMGNCYDRVTLGHVRDFVHFHVDAVNFNCAIFNFADNMLVIGACTLVLFALKPDKSRSNDPDAPALWSDNLTGQAADPADGVRENSPGHAADARSIPDAPPRPSSATQREILNFNS
jgi:signal peptidase II